MGSAPETGRRAVAHRGRQTR